jgi:hypothetical protein
MKAYKEIASPPSPSTSTLGSVMQALFYFHTGLLCLIRGLPEVCRLERDKSDYEFAFLPIFEARFIRLPVLSPAKTASYANYEFFWKQ